MKLLWEIESEIIRRLASNSYISSFVETLMRRDVAYKDNKKCPKPFESIS